MSTPETMATGNVQFFRKETILFIERQNVLLDKVNTMFNLLNRAEWRVKII